VREISKQTGFFETVLPSSGYTIVIGPISFLHCWEGVVDGMFETVGVGDIGTYIVLGVGVMDSDTDVGAGVNLAFCSFCLWSD
jgi:hypothetical protein